MFIKKVKQTLILEMIINTILSLFMLIIYCQNILNNDIFFNLFYLGFPISLLCIILGIEWYSVLFQSKNSLPIRQYLEQLIQKHTQEFEPYHQVAQNAFMKYATTKGITTIIYYFLLNVCLMAFIYFLFIKDSPLLLTLLITYLFIFVIVLVRNIFCIYILNKKYYFCYIEPQNQGFIYILMTYYLLQVNVSEEVLVPYFDLANISATLSRELYFEEGYEYIQLWKKNLKKFPPIYQFLYIEHCIAHLSMLDRHNEVELAYQDYLATQNKHSLLKKNKNVIKMTYCVSLSYAYSKQDWQTIIDLEKNYYQYFDKLQEHDAYYFYCAYKHIDEEKAHELLQNYPNNKFFKKYIINE